MADFKLAVDDEHRATEFRLLRLRGSVQQNPHMRAFWASTISCFLAMLGWFALAPLSVEVARSIGICENQLYPPSEFPTRAAYLRFESLRAGRYCRYGTVRPEDPMDCRPAPQDAMGPAAEKYDPSVLPGCVCTSGTRCAGVLADAGLASVASGAFARIAMGTLLERWGPVNTQASVLAFGALWVAAAAGISAEWNLILVRFFCGAIGACFVNSQYWCSIMFAPKRVGTASSTAAGLGGFCGGLTDIFMLVVLFSPLKASGLSADSSWRLAMMVPAALLLICAVCTKLLCWDTPTEKRSMPADTQKAHGPSMWDYLDVMKDVKVLLITLQLSASIGPGVMMYNKLSTHFRIYFQMSAGDAVTLASAFGCMGLFARPLGGLLSDAMYSRFGFRGRLWAQFATLALQAVFFFCFGLVDNRQPWTVALGVLLFFALFVQMSGATSCAILPFVRPDRMAVASALVMAGANLLAVGAGFAFYRPIRDPLTQFKLHAAYVLCCALLTPLYYWPEHGGMFWRPEASEREEEPKLQADLEAQAKPHSGVEAPAELASV